MNDSEVVYRPGLKAWWSYARLDGAPGFWRRAKPGARLRQCDRERADWKRWFKETAPPWRESEISSGTFRKRPLMVEARRWDGSYVSAQEIMQWAGPDNFGYQEAVVPPQSSDVAPVVGTPARFWLYTANGTADIGVGWWVVREPSQVETWPLSVLAPTEMSDLHELIEIPEGTTAFTAEEVL